LARLEPLFKHENCAERDNRGKEDKDRVACDLTALAVALVAIVCPSAE